MVLFRTRNLRPLKMQRNARTEKNGTFQSVGDILSFSKGLSKVLCYLNFNSKSYDSKTLTLLKSSKRGK